MYNTELQLASVWVSPANSKYMMDRGINGWMDGWVDGWTDHEYGHISDYEFLPLDCSNLN